MKTENLLWPLLWAVMALVLVVGQYQLKLGRDNDRLHAAVDASTVPPSTNNVSTR